MINNQKLSTRSWFISVMSRFPLPQMCRSGPSPCLSSATFFATSPFKNTEGCHSEEVMVFEPTYFVALLTFGQISPSCPQHPPQLPNPSPHTHRTTPTSTLLSS